MLEKKLITTFILLFLGSATRETETLFMKKFGAKKGSQICKCTSYSIFAGAIGFISSIAFELAGPVKQVLKYLN